ncbi:LysR family transcriptional regulator [Clostridium cylindrosporum]|uniref:HTH-type transcriptional regulator CysL n=1 Tax=Clostridium cylindrosporum DSM 605 TaxID=1121307 RepID=A0A0J8DGM0_CLOCY|nr:LysR family transcriptional regulator [Clostridium cylindrosporum]KMT23333.1 HTH-type transcriptional regulator CysL [Clostridium cylindrosporum DSM 605]
MIEELKTFVAVVEYNNFTKAAEAINMSQPAVSQQIKSLERMYDTVLIQRSHREKKIIITPEGKILYKRAKEIISLLREVKYEMEGYKKEFQGIIRIGASYTIGEFFIPKFLGEFTKAYPKIEFDITIDNTRTICKKVSDMILDIGLVEGYFNCDEFIYDAFKEDILKLAVKKGYIDKGQVFKKKDFKDSVWISREEGSGTRQELETFFREEGIVPKKIMVFGSNYSIKEAVKHGLGVTLTSEAVLNEAIELDEVDIIRTSKEYKRKFHYILPKGKIHSRLSILLVKMLKELNVK